MAAPTNGFHDATSPTSRSTSGSQQPHRRAGSTASTSGSSSNTLADLTSVVRRTSGQVPPGLVGFSSTVFGDKLYVFGGRLVHVRRMVSDLYALDLHTLVWEKLWPPEDQQSSSLGGPQPRYFHSADAWGHKLVIFGGMGQSPEDDSHQRQESGQTENGGPDPNLSVLSDILIYDTVTRSWQYPPTVVRPGVQEPLARYAHLSAVTNNCLIILGGQDILNRYIEQLSCFDLETMTYVSTSDWKGHAGTYRSIAVSRRSSIHAASGSSSRHRDSAHENHAGDADASGIALSNLADESLQLPFSTSAEGEEPVFTFTNYNFADVRRALDMISAPAAPDYSSSITPLSDLMVGSPSLPPGLRFPTAAMIGSHLVLTGTLITQQVSSFAIWTLDLSKATSPAAIADKPKLVWQKIDAGHALKSGSWNRAVAWRNSIVILGDRDREIAVDYNKRQNNFTHVVQVDLETFGIYQPPRMVLPFVAQEYGLNSLNQQSLSDFTIICADGIRLTCSRKVLEVRWPWFKQELQSHTSRKQREAEESAGGLADGHSNGSDQHAILTPYHLRLPESSTVGMAVLQYFYTLNLITPLQHSLPVLVSLLLFAREYDVNHLRALVAHALHGFLTRASSNSADAALIYEAAALGGCLPLQVRALKLMMNANAKHGKARPPAIDTARRV